MHIAVLSDPNHFHTQKWVRGLLKAGVRVSVLSFFEGNIPGAHCIRVPPSFTFRGKLTYFSYLYSGKALLRELRQLRPDVLNPINVTPYGVWGQSSGYRPMVQVAMGADILEYPPRLKDLDISQERLYGSSSLGMPSFLQRLIFPLKWRIFRKNVALALRESHFAIGDNWQLVEAMQKWFGIEKSKLQLNRWGIEEAYFKENPKDQAQMRKSLGIREGYRVVLAPRGLKPVYQGDVILNAFENVLKKAPQNLHFVVLSAGYKAAPQIEQKALRLNQDFANFTYVKRLIPWEQMGTLWQITDAFVIAPVYDGYSNALNEGLYAGAIPILNDIPAHREMMAHGHNCLMVNPFNADRLANEIMEIMDHFEKWKEKFAPINRAWVEEEALFERNIQRFLEGVEARIYQRT